jgi:hypothetical protein
MRWDSCGRCDCDSPARTIRSSLYSRKQRVDCQRAVGRAPCPAHLPRVFAFCAATYHLLRSYAAGAPTVNDPGCGPNRMRREVSTPAYESGQTLVRVIGAGRSIADIHHRSRSRAADRLARAAGLAGAVAIDGANDHMHAVGGRARCRRTAGHGPSLSRYGETTHEPFRAIRRTVAAGLLGALAGHPHEVGRIDASRDERRDRHAANLRVGTRRLLAARQWPIGRASVGRAGRGREVAFVRRTGAATAGDRREQRDGHRDDTNGDARRNHANSDGEPSLVRRPRPGARAA